MKTAHVLATAAALVATGVFIFLATAFQSRPDTGHAAVTPSARTQAVASLASGSPVTARVPAAGPATSTARTAAARSSATRTTPTASASAPLAGRIRPGVTYHGVATEYSAGNGDGACLFGPAANLMIAAMNYTDYETAKACGAYVLVRAADGASVTVLITNECPLPCAPGQIDLSQQAFARLASPALGRISITWKLLSPAVSRTISIRYKTGSSRWWCAIQVIGHRNPVALLEVRADNRWRRLPRTSYNYFISGDGSGCGGPIRVTDIYGQQLTINGIALLPNAVQPTQVQFARH